MSATPEWHERHRLELLREARERLPQVKRGLEVFQADPRRPEALEQAREYFHRMAGVAAPCGLPLLGALARVSEELLILMGGEGSPLRVAGPRMLLRTVEGLEAFLAAELPPEPAPAPVPAPALVPAPVEPAAAPSEAQKVLIVDDDPLSARLIEVCLRQAGFLTRYCRDPRTAIAELDAERPDLILLDLMMPGQDGLETCRQIRLVASSDRIPIIFLTQVKELQEKVEALRSGGDDYVTKPFEPAELVARVRAHVRRHTVQREQIIRDALTGCYTPRYFKQRLNQEVRRQERLPSPLCLALVSLDRFKQFNDQEGPSAGDALLKGVAQQASVLLRRTDVLARQGGDEFALLLPDTPLFQAAPLLERLVQGVRTTRIAPRPGREVGVTLSVGLAEWRPGESASTFQGRAEEALSEARRDGHDRLVISEAAPPAAPAQAEPTPSAAQALKILLVDDSRLTREVLKVYLLSMDVTLMDAENGHEALERIRRERPNLVLADMRMPRLDGLGLCGALQADPALADIPVIILTGHLEPALAEACRKAGARDVLAKPVEPLELLSIVNRHLDRR